MTTKWDELKRLAALFPKEYSKHTEKYRQFRAVANPAAVLELIAEVERYDEGMRSMACQLSAGGYNAKHLTAELLVGKVQWGIDNLANESGALIDELRAKVGQLTEENKRIRAANLDGADWVSAARADMEQLNQRLHETLEKHRATLSQLEQKERECEELRTQLGLNLRSYRAVIDSDVELLIRWVKGATQRELGEEAGCTPENISRKVRRARYRIGWVRGMSEQEIRSKAAQIQREMHGGLQAAAEGFSRGAAMAKDGASNG